ncbi:hypothetical protein, partial [Phocaeicola coprocola]|uniref:hypothetical protein n=1 Tax=Phocaeicola coprocola TaxID=310298 RepID=UPI003A8DB5D9
VCDRGIRWFFYKINVIIFESFFDSNQLNESEERSIPVCGNTFPRLGEVYLYSNMKILLSFS